MLLVLYSLMEIFYMIFQEKTYQLFQGSSRLAKRVLYFATQIVKDKYLPVGIGAPFWTCELSQLKDSLELIICNFGKYVLRLKSCLGVLS